MPYALRALAIAAALLCGTRMSLAQAPSPAALPATQPDAEAHPYPKGASFDTISTWLHGEYSRLARADAYADLKAHPERPAPQCMTISVVPRPDALPENEWTALAKRCADEIRAGSPAQQLEAIHFLSHIEQVSMSRPEFVAKLPRGFGAAVAGVLASDNAQVRLAAVSQAGILRYIGPDALVTVPGLLKALADPDAKLRSAASSSLSSLALGLDMQGFEPQPKGLGEHGPAAVEALLAAAKDSDSRVRITVLSTIGNLGEAARPAVPKLTELTRSEDRVTRAGAFMALKGLGPIAADRIPDLIKALREGAERDRTQAAHAIGAMGTTARDAVPALIESLDDPSSSVSTAAARALGEIGPDAAPALLRLAAAVEKDPNAFGGYARRAIDQIAGK
jgi:HEAT repeat protein